MGDGTIFYFDSTQKSEKTNFTTIMKPTFPGQRPDYFHSQEPETSNANQAGSSSNSQGESSTEQIEPRPSEPITYRQHSLQTALLAHMLPRTRHQAEYFAEWDAWAQANEASGENRTEAVNRLKAWLIADQLDEPLNLSRLGLTSLPESLPARLQFLDASHNQLTRLRDLPDSIETLHCYNNQLILLALPASIVLLFAFNNQLTRVPDNLPDSLKILDLRSNQLTDLPEDIITRHQDCIINVGNNLIPEEVRNHFQAMMCAENYAGPNISIEQLDDEESDDEAWDSYVSPNITIGELDDEESDYYEISLAASSFDATPVRPLEDAVSDWHDESNENFKATWRAFAHEEGADAFSEFLDSLRKTVNYDNPEFKKNIVQWLSHLADHPGLRKASFAISVGATESCQDRVSLTYNEMKKARVAADVKDGKYDNRLDELILLSRRMFRVDELEKIAKEKFKSLERQEVEDPDEVEVYLAYQVKLREKLDLPLDTSNMAYFSSSYVTEDDLKTAAENVEASEKENFIHYLSTEWTPWQSVLERLYPEHYAATENMRYEALDSFESRVDAYLEEHGGLHNDSDARREAGVRVEKTMAYEVNDPLTLQFLAEKNLSHLLAFMNSAESVNASPFEKTRNPQLGN